MRPETTRTSRTAVTVSSGSARFIKAWLSHGTLLLLATLPASRGDRRGNELHVFQPTLGNPLASDDCPSSCSHVFGRLDEGSYKRQRKVQVVRVQERGGGSVEEGWMHWLCVPAAPVKKCALSVRYIRSERPSEGGEDISLERLPGMGRPLRAMFFV